MTNKKKKNTDTVSVDLRLGDCLDVLKTLPDNSVDSIVTDPPYGLSFMGKRWDYDVPGTDVWAECLRVLKPGGHMVAFFGSRTYHRGVVRIEDAGFEIRDQIMWVYGSGFPKSLDVSKAIDKMRVEDLPGREAVRAFLYTAWKASGIKSDVIDRHFGFTGSMSGPHWFYKTSQNTVPTWEQWVQLKSLLSLSDEMDTEVWRLNGRKGKPGDNWEKREVVGKKSSGIANKAEGPRHTIGASTSVEVDITTPATPAARTWSGWGTALKPAHEPIVLARKPLAGTVAQNVLEHGTGALNIDGCRVGNEKVSVHNAPKGTFAGGEPGRGSDTTYREHTGRWPANFIHDGSDEATELLGDAARFFYCAKANRKDRNEGLDDFEPKQVNLGRQGVGEGEVGGISTPQQNHHPTVKPTALMQYLCRLVTPPGGIVLDPFCGSGSTGKGAVKEGFNFIGIEREAEYVEIAKARIAAAKK